MLLISRPRARPWKGPSCLFANARSQNRETPVKLLSLKARSGDLQMTSMVTAGAGYRIHIGLDMIYFCFLVAKTPSETSIV